MNNKTARYLMFFLASFFIILLLMSNKDTSIEHARDQYNTTPATDSKLTNSAPTVASIDTSIEKKPPPIKTDYSKENIAKNLQPSKFNKRCLDKLNAVTKSMREEIISKATQTSVMNVLNDCVYEIDMELALTEKEFSPIDNNTTCLNKAYKIRDSLLDLGVEAQNFGSLPSDTELDRTNISTSFIRISNNIIVKGSAAMENRSINCSPN